MTKDMNNIDVQQLVDYHCKDFLYNSHLFQQVYEEITTFAHWVKGFTPHNVLEIGFKGSSFHIISQLSTGKLCAVDIEDGIRAKVAHYMMYGKDFKLFIANSQTEETREMVKEFCPEYDLIFIDGDHSYEGVKKDFELYQSLLSERGYIVFHDIDPNHIFKGNKGGGDVWKFWQDLDYGSKTNIVTIKSSGKTKVFGEPQGFGGIGIWKPIK